MTATRIKSGCLEWLSQPPEGRYSASAGNLRTFCTRCGGALTWQSETDPGVIYIQTPTLDDPSGLEVSYEIFTRSRLFGQSPVDGVAQFEGLEDGAIKGS